MIIKDISVFWAYFYFSLLELKRLESDGRLYFLFFFLFCYTFLESHNRFANNG